MSDRMIMDDRQEIVTRGGDSILVSASGDDDFHGGGPVVEIDIGDDCMGILFGLDIENAERLAVRLLRRAKRLRGEL